MSSKNSYVLPSWPSRWYAFRVALAEWIKPKEPKNGKLYREFRTGDTDSGFAILMPAVLSFRDLNRPLRQWDAFVEEMLKNIRACYEDALQQIRADVVGDVTSIYNGVDDD